MKVLVYIFSFVMFCQPAIEVVDPIQKETNQTKEGRKSFAEFLSYFEKSDQALNIGHSQMNAYKNLSHLSEAKAKNSIVSNRELQDFLPAARPKKFSRLGGDLVTPLHRFYPADDMVAVTYLSRRRFSEMGFSIKLTIFDLKGNPLTSLNGVDAFESAFVVANFPPLSTMLCEAHSKTVFIQTTFNHEREKDIEEHGIPNNPIIDYITEKSDVVTIDRKGNLNVVVDAYAKAEINKH